MQCTPDERFDYAVFLLQGDAYNWWKTVPDSLVQPPVLSCNDFLWEYRGKYAPEVYRRKKRREFIELKQNDMTVAEYELKFTQLSVYATNLVATEEEKCLIFEERLTYKIRSKLTPYDIETFPRLIAAAIRAEKLVNEKKVLLPGSEKSNERIEKRKHQDSVPSVPHKDRKSEGKGMSSKEKSVKSVPYLDQMQKRGDSKQKPHCPTCGKNHSGECRRVIGRCYLCGDKGHRYKNCPNRPNIGRNISESARQ